MADDIAREVAALAITAAGPVGSDELAWTRRVAQFSMLIGSMLRPSREEYQDLATTPIVVARKVLEADVYRGEFVSISDEELDKTHRLLVRVKPEHGKQKYLDADGCEWLRTEPRWTPAGFVMQRFLRNLAPTTPVLIFKYVEGFTSRGDEAEDKKSRVLVHIEQVGKPRVPPGESAPAPQQAQRPQADAAGAAGRPQSAPAAPSESNGNPDIVARFNKLPATKQIAYMRACRGNDIATPLDPDPDHIDRAIQLLDKVERGEALT